MHQKRNRDRVRIVSAYVVAQWCSKGDTHWIKKNRTLSK